MDSRLFAFVFAVLCLSLSGVADGQQTESLDNIFILEAMLLSDRDGDGRADPGDVIQYTLSGRGSFDFEVYPETESLHFLPGSVEVRRGAASVKEGNEKTSQRVLVSSASASSRQVVVSFDVAIKKNLPADVSSVSLQGLVRTDHGDFLTTSSFSLASQPTVVPVDANADIEVALTSTIISGDKNGNAVPGTVIEYKARLTNIGNQQGRDVWFFDELPENAVLIEGTIKTNGQAYTNKANFVNVSFASMSEDEFFDVTFRAEVTKRGHVVNQAHVCNKNAHSDTVCRQSYDPRSGVSSSPTIVRCDTEGPIMHATKAVSIGGVPTGVKPGEALPGDSLKYTIRIANLDSNPISGVRFEDQIPDGTTIVLGSVVTSSGVVISGNDYNFQGNTKNYYSKNNNPNDNADDNAKYKYTNDNGNGNGNGNNGKVIVDCGEVQPGDEIIIEFCVTVDSVLEDACISNQGQVSWSSGGSTVTDDPATLPLLDPTVVCVNAGPVVEATNSWARADGSVGPVAPGEAICYTVTIKNTGASAAQEVVFSESCDSRTAITTGSVRSTCGTVTSGNTPYNKDVGVFIPAIGSGESCTIRYDVTVNNPFNDNNPVVSTQGVVSGSNFDAIVTDDPATPVWDDATNVPIDASPAVVMSKSASLKIDYDFDNLVDPGDVVQYTVVVKNSGNAPASSLLLRDIPDTRTSLRLGTVKTSQGKVTSGDSEFDSSVEVDLGDLPGYSSATITFDVIVSNPFPAGKREIVNQAVLTYNALGATYVLVSGDPSTPVIDDPTYTPVDTAPDVKVDKTSELVKDVNGDGKVGPGDTLQYLITIVNNGNQEAGDLSLLDELDSNTQLVLGSVRTSGSRAAVVSGNAATDPEDVVRVDIGDLAGAGGSYSVTFSVIVKDTIGALTTTITNEAVVTGADVNSIIVSGTDVTEITDGAPDVTMTLVAEQDYAVPGGQLRYTAEITNSGTREAANVYFTIPQFDPNTQFVLGSGTTSQGTIVEGRYVADTTLVVNLGGINAKNYARVSFSVKLNTPFPADASSVTLQTVVTGANFADVVSTDPATNLLDAPTVTPVQGNIDFNFGVTYSISQDANQNGKVDPGDGLQYIITIENSGNQDAGKVVVTDITPEGLLFLAGSVQTSQGSVTTGNNAGDSGFSKPVVVAVGELAGAGGSAVITFETIVETPWTICSNVVSNQATASGANFDDIVSDDPTTTLIDDPTLITLNAVPVVSAIRSTDPDDGQPLTPFKENLEIKNQGLQDGCSVVAVLGVLGPVDAATITVSQGQATYDSESDQITWNVGTLVAESGDATLTFEWNIDDPCAEGDTTEITAENFATISLPGRDVGGACNNPRSTAEEERDIRFEDELEDDSSSSSLKASILAVAALAVVALY